MIGFSNDWQLTHANGVELCTETFGDAGHPPLLLIGNSMLEWDAELCGRLAGAGRHVIRYDLRDTGLSTIADPDAPAYSQRDLAADAAALVGALGLADAHVVGRGPGGWIAQLVALDHPDTVRTLTLVGSRPTSPGKADEDLSDHEPELMAALFSGSQPDWAAQRASQQGTHFAAMKSGGRWRERLGQITAPTLVVHGEDDPFFPIGNGEALANEIPGARLLRLPGVGQELPPRAWDQFAAAVLEHTAS